MARKTKRRRAGTGYRLIETDGVPIKAWIRGVAVEDAALEQLRNVALLPFVHRHIAAMPDVHWGLGATIGSVIPCRGAVVPAAVGVDIGCGMTAVRTTLGADRLPDRLDGLRSEIEKAVPHGRTSHGGKGDRGAWGQVPDDVAGAWESPSPAIAASLADGLANLSVKHPEIGRSNSLNHLGTLGTGNHFIEVCLDEEDRVWAMLHSGSRGVGNRIGSYFISQAKGEMERWFIALPDPELAYLAEGTPLFVDYIEAVAWAQCFAATSRRLMMDRVLAVMAGRFPGLEQAETAIDCHHNFVARENHFGANLWITRKGAVRARDGDLGIIPGSMGARSFIVRGRGNPESFHSCSHGAGRAMSRNAARKRFTLADHENATRGVECRKDDGVLDETPGAYKDIDAVMAAQEDLVEVLHTLKQVLCVKG